MNDLEEKYTEGIEREGELFLEGLQNKKDIGQLEKEYSKKVKEIRRIYEKSMRRELQKERESWEIKNKANLQGKEEKEFQVHNLNLEKNWGEKKHIEIISSSYRLKRKIKNTIYKITPNGLMYIYYKIKRIIKDSSKEVRGFLRRKKDKVLERMVKSGVYVKEGFLAVVAGFKIVLNLFRRKKKKEGDGKAKEDGKKDTEKQDK
jgi:hypothetical protein